MSGYEDQLQQACILWWHNYGAVQSSSLRGLTLEQGRKRLHCNNNNSVNRVAGNRAKAMGVQPGVADLEFMMAGGLICFIELKRPGGTQSKEQKVFELMCDFMGYEYHLVFTLEQFKTIINGRL